MSERVDASAATNAALAAFASMHADDPERIEVKGEPLSWSVHYHARLRHWVEHLDPNASDALRLAAACQHVRRWTIPRGDYPVGPLGYKKWRSTLALFHADEAERVLRDAGFGDDTVARVRALLVKKGLKTDPEVQLFEDAICLTFLENQLADFAGRHDDDKVVDILRKTWAKMTPRGHAAALDLAAGLPADLRALVTRAVVG